MSLARVSSHAYHTSTEEALNGQFLWVEVCACRGPVPYFVRIVKHGGRPDGEGRRPDQTAKRRHDDSPDFGLAKLVVLLTDSTEVGQVEGGFKVRRKDNVMASVIPGLAVKVEGAYNDQNQMIAKSVSFKGNDLEQAEAIQAGMHETQVQARQNEEELSKQNAALKQQQAALTERQQTIAANKVAIAEASALFGQLDDYYIRDEITVYFGNGQNGVDPKYVPQLAALAEKAKTINGYMIEVKGYASAVGNAAYNQRLSEDRANAVINILLQQGNVPLTRMLAPGSMGESHQVAMIKPPNARPRIVVSSCVFCRTKAIAGTYSFHQLYDEAAEAISTSLSP